jgi:hypothetical protein
MLQATSSSLTTILIHHWLFFQEQKISTTIGTWHAHPVIFCWGSFCDAVTPCESSRKTPYAWTARSNPLQPDGNLASYRQTPNCSNHILHTSKLVPFALIYRDLDIEIPFLEKPCDAGIKQPTKFPNLILHTCKTGLICIGRNLFLKCLT